MKALLVNPPLSKNFPSSSCYPPLGLASLAAFIEENNINVGIIDAAIEELSSADCVKRILSSSPDLIGITAMTPIYPQALEIAKLIKQEVNTPVCLGGPHATFMSDAILSTGYFDFVVRGEGELTLLELCKTFQNGKRFELVKGLSFVKNGKIFNNPPREFIQNLDTLPKIAYHLLPFEKYQSKAPPGFVRGKPWLTMITSRGCPFACKFCSTSELWGKIWRACSPERVVSDMEEVISKYNLRSLFFVDDNFTFHKKRIEEICSKIIEKSLRIEFACNCRVDQVDLNLLSKMYDAGCWRIGFGIEAGTQQVLDWYKKKITPESARKAIKLCKEVGISPICYFIIGAPFETEEMIMSTIEFAKELDVDATGFSFLVPFPGTELYEYCLENNLIPQKIWENFSQNIPLIRSYTMSQENLLGLGKSAYRKFYFRPKFLLRQSVKILKDPVGSLKGLKTILNWIK